MADLRETFPKPVFLRVHTLSKKFLFLASSMPDSQI
jgi:hypothetical protein